MRTNEFLKQFPPGLHAWEGKVTISLGYPHEGWIQFVITCTAFSQGLIILCSNAFDPFPGLFRWLNAIAEGQSPAVCVIDEEGHGKVLRATPINTDEFLFEILDMVETDEEETLEEKSIFLYAQVSRRQFLSEFLKRWDDFLANQYDPAEWENYGTDLRKLDAGKIRAAALDTHQQTNIPQPGHIKLALQGSMNIHGLDFTSNPGTKKPITWAQCSLSAGRLTLDGLELLRSFAEFEHMLQLPGPWLAGMDFPFGQPRLLVENIGWPQSWAGYVSTIGQMTRVEFVALLAQYRKERRAGDKQHLRATDRQANSRSPMMLYGVPVGKMFFEGAPRLLRSGASILPCHPQDDARLILEAYPALVARRFIGNQGYKNDTKKKQTKEQALARQAILQGLLTKAMTNFGFEVILSEDQVSSLSCDPTGDKLDALLCAVQAAWAYRQKDSNYGIPAHVDPLEGWIIDPQFLMG